MTMPSTTSSPLCVYEVPLAFDPSSNMVKGFEPEGAEQRIRRYVEDSREWTLGPMPVAEFMRYFFGPPGEISDALNKSTKHKSRCPGFVFDNASARATLGHMKPHACLYRMDQEKVVRSADPQSLMELGYTELFIEVAADPTQDFFTDPPKDAHDDTRASHEFLNRSKDATFNCFLDRALGQHISYVTEIFARQLPRVFLYTVSVGTVPDGGRGRDPTVQPATRAEEAVFVECITAHLRSQLTFHDSEVENALSEQYLPNHVTVEEGMGRWCGVGWSLVRLRLNVRLTVESEVENGAGDAGIRGYGDAGIRGYERRETGIR
ncbi:hypothetical protein OH76DRAFT_1490516 [Lentinus brumalis]|uniref:Uncharacterized protein n=1 Tax=Lentinus brumalis TaxID=2498619 RepID=A0A371CIQ6_9APHY|nr:hypothetical protein OH76DRAFT_1490516 [Polyporus brumalis]